jgi:hypothetical protein
MERSWISLHQFRNNIKIDKNKFFLRAESKVQNKNLTGTEMFCI